MVITNFLVIGSGVAGLTLAVKLASEFPSKTVTIVTKSNESESNTKYAQGGVAAVFNGEADSFEKHIIDTLQAGDGLCDKKVVEMVITEGPKRLFELMEWGARFDRDASGNVALGREGGHSEDRVLHHKDMTGFEIERALLEKVHGLPNIQLLPHHFAVDIITEHHLLKVKTDHISSFGAYVLDQVSGNIITLKADTTTIATGGLGQVYGHTTNPSVATGDGIAMAYRAKARIKDMEFIQFHPTALYDGKEGASFLISEAIRGFGALLRNAKGERFMLQYDSRAELASRDIVARAIDSELKKTGDPCVYLDCTHLNINELKIEFPTIYETCQKKGIMLSKDWIPVVPAAHYACGGIEVDLIGRTSVLNLFACGECSRTGLHGANRLASNSLLEALVYAHHIFDYHCKNSFSSSTIDIPNWKDAGVILLEDQKILHKKIRKLQKLMRRYVGILRSSAELQKASKELEKQYVETEALYQKHKLNTSLCELRNMVNVAHMIIDQSIQRTENKGGYYNIDYSNNNQSKRSYEKYN
jgi:L-aspartate oxidase